MWFRIVTQRSSESETRAASNATKTVDRYIHNFEASIATATGADTKTEFIALPFVAADIGYGSTFWLRHGFWQELYHEVTADAFEKVHDQIGPTYGELVPKVAFDALNGL